MLTIKLKNALFATTGLVLGLCLSTLFRGCSSHCPAIADIKPTVIEKKVAADESRYRGIAESLQQRGNIITASLNATQKKYDTERRNSIRLQTQLADVTEKYTQAVKQKDTVRMLEDCDSLFPRARELIQSAKLQDSLCIEGMAQLQALVQVKDSMLQVHTGKYDALKANFEKSITGLQLASAENKTLKKQIRKQKRKAVLLSAVGVIVSGLSLKWLLLK